MKLGNWRKPLGEARTRILVWYVVLMVFFMLVSIPAIRQILFVRVQERIEQSINQEVEEFYRLRKGRNPDTSKPFGQDSAALFNVFLSRNIPDESEFLLTLLNGQLYKSNPKVLPSILQADSVLIRRWAQATQTERGELSTPMGAILYRVEPVIVDRKVVGVVAVVRTTTRERRELHDVITVVIEVMVVVLTLSFVLAWLAAGRVLAPLHVLTATARSISESDLTERISVQGTDDLAELATTFNDMMDRLQAAFASQRDFINDAGHELRIPITIIRGHLELIGDDPIEQKETQALVLDELDRLSRFVEDLVLLTKAERPDFLQLETVNVGVLTEELLAKARALADRDWQLDAVGKGQMVGDRQRITQAVMNLAQNATQHTREGDRISLGSAVTKHHIEFWVRDTGEGIDPADQQRIFERFARAAHSRRRSEGAGLGLPIVQAIAEAHHGRVTLCSRPGTGATFTLVLPLEPSSETMPHASDSHR
ncbi:MAG: HAMP domain-containing histidine kinase [Myxacorys californica WJT36-NPBG1]|jgi:signal transduction histidine kinase|nr:HAMP domain-containing histidine kinase [Myxacorys californica WJT36-NPBG1]